MARRQALRGIDPASSTDGALSRAIGLPDAATTLRRMVSGLTLELRLGA